MSFIWLDRLEAEKKTETDYGKCGSRWEIVLRPDRLEAAARAAWEEGYFLEDVSVVDVQEGFLVVYHFDRWQAPGRIAFKVLVPHDKPEVPTLSHIHSGANWHERESFDFFGIVFTGHPDLKPLLLPDDLGFHPLVKKAEARAPMAGMAVAGAAESSASKEGKP
ncbi:MAG: NADH-quinone oxidoreductase subunit C [bacterium]